MNKPVPGNDVKSAFIAVQIRRMCDNLCVSEAKRLGLSDLHSQLVAGHGQMHIRNSLAEAGEGVVDVGEIYEFVRSVVVMAAAHFHDLEQLEAGWAMTLYPSMDIMLFVWARAKRSGTNGLGACIKLRDEFRVRNEAIAKVVIGHLLRSMDSTEHVETYTGAFAGEIAFRVSDYAESLLEELPPVAVDFQEPANGLEALEMFDEGIALIPDEDLPILPYEINAIDCVNAFMREMLSQAGRPAGSMGIVDLEPLETIGRHVAKYAFIALGLPLH